MLGRVAFFLKRNKQVLCERVFALEELIEDLAASVQSMDEMNRSQEFSKTKKQTTKKKLVKEELLRAIDRLIRGLTSYAYKMKDTEMINKVEFTKYQLGRLMPEKTADHCKEVIDIAKSTGELWKYGIKPEHIAQAEQHLKDFRDVMRSPQQRKKQRAAEREYLEEMLKECLLQLEKQIDGLVELATEDDFQLRYTYKEVRKVFPTGQGRKTEKEKRYLASRKRKPKV